MTLCLFALLAVSAALAGSFPGLPASPVMGGEPSLLAFRRLPFRETVEFRFSRSGEETSLLPLNAGVYIEIFVKELPGTDVQLFLWSPDGRRLQEVDTLFINNDPTEVLATVTETAGTYRLVIMSEPGGYSVFWKTARPASPRDRLRAEAHTAFSQGEVLRRARRWRDAFECYQRALGSWSRLGDPLGAAQARYRLGLVHKEQYQYVQALEAWEAVLPVWRGTAYEADLLNEIGSAKRSLGQASEAIEDFKRSVALARDEGRTALQADSYNRMGRAYYGLGEFQKALDSFQGALMLNPERDLNHALFMANLAEVLMDLGDYGRALDLCLRALGIIEKKGSEGDMLSPLRTLGLTYLEMGDELKALEALQWGEALARKQGFIGEQAKLLNALGNVHLAGGRHGEARRVHEVARRLALEAGDEDAVAHACGNLGYLVDQAGYPREAIGLFDCSVSIYERKGYRLHQAQALSGKALALWHLGRFEDAQETLEQLIGIIEALRAEPENSRLRTSFFASRQRGYDAYVSLIMERHRLRPDAGLDRLAFEAAELTRGRSLLEDLGRLRLKGVAPELLQGLQKRDRILIQALARDDAAAPPAQEAGRGTGEDGSESRLSTLVQPVSVAELQRSIADEQTLILAYKLGTPKSYLWLIGRDLAKSYELPGRFLIEEQVRETRSLLARSSKRALRAKVARKTRELAVLLLGPVAVNLGRKRLVIIPDGELHSFPFGVLPDPTGWDQPLEEGWRWWPVSLIENHEISYVPSASVLALIREQAVSRQPAPKTLALLAPEADETVSFVASPGEDRLAALPSLPFSRQEAAVIREQVSADRRTVAIGPAASLRFARDTALGRHQIIHFAGHALVDPSDLARSGLVLVRIDATGQPRRELLGIEEIHELDLPVDLVVLSACSTGLGEQVPGEGLVGLTRGFLYAGASRVVASLWNVQDSATRDLMERFYGALLDRGLSPAAALRKAQIDMLRNGDQQAPYYWGGFVLQGEWR